MLLFVTATNEGIHYPEMCFPINDHESAFELLTQLVIDHWSLQQAVIVGVGERLELPLAAFDGQPIRVHIQALQQQWQQLLTTPLVPPFGNTELPLKEWYTQLDNHYEKMLSYLAQTILRLQIQQAKATLRSAETVGIRLGDQYAILLASNRRMFQQTNESRRKNQRRLKALID